MSCQLITAPTFPLLEERLLADLRRACDKQSLAPQWVVVPSATLANHLRACLARDTGDAAFANVRVVNLPRFAQRLSQSLTGRDTPRWYAMLDLLLCELVENLEFQSPLANLKEISGGAALLREAFSDLAEGGFGAGELEKLRDLAEEPDVAPREREVLRQYAQFCTLARDRNVAWSPLSLQDLPEAITKATDAQLSRALSAEHAQQPQLFLYGFYDWIDVHLGWLTALGHRVPMRIYYPWTLRSGKPHPAFSFADTVLTHLRNRFSFDHEEEISPSEREPEAFFLATFPEGEIHAHAPSFLTVQRAAGVRAEAISAALRVRRWIDESNLDPADILVVAPQAENYVEAVQDMFRTFAIPLRVADVPAGPTPEGETLRMLARIWEGQAPAEWILALLRACPDIPAANGLDLDRFEWKVRELGVWGGAAWRQALTRGKFTAAHEEKGDRVIQFDETERAFVRRLLIFVRDEDGAPSARLSLDDGLRVLRELAERWVDTPAMLTPLIRAVEATVRHCPRLQIELTQWTRFLVESGGTHTLRDPLDRAVLFTPLMRARGLTPRAVVLLGLAAGQFPHRVEDDPLLSEVASVKLARRAEELGHWFPVKARATEEMQLLFLLLNTAAERIHWIVPETDAQGKAVAPTPWVQRYLLRWPAKQVDRIARAPFEQAKYLAALDPERGSLLPPNLAMFGAPKLEIAEPFLADSIAKRGREKAWSGCIGRQPSLKGDRVGVTALEALARCPFRFYAQTVARWEPLEALSLSRGLDALSRGGLLHTLLEYAVARNPDGTIGEIAGKMLRAGCKELWAVAKSLADIDPDAAFALAMLPPVFKEAALRDIVEMAARYFESVRGDSAKPRYVEEMFVRKFPRLSDIEVVGTIDRIDDTDAGTALLDYKSGKKSADFRKLVKLGWHIQAALYPWLCNRPDAEFSYVFLGGREPEVGNAKDAPAAELFLAELASILKEGHFIPLSNQVTEEEWELKDVRPCQWCKFVSACRRFEPGSAHLHGQLLATVLPARVAVLTTAVAPQGRKKS